MSENATYEGWTNYETWCVKMWLDNEQDTQEHVRDMVRTVKRLVNDRPFWTREEYERFTFSPMLLDYVQELTDANAPTSGLAADLFTSALDSVAFDELAESYLTYWEGES